MREERNVEGCGAAVEGDGVLDADVLGECALEGGDTRALRKLTGSECSRDGLLFVFEKDADAFVRSSLTSSSRIICKPRV